MSRTPVRDQGHDRLTTGRRDHADDNERNASGGAYRAARTTAARLLTRDTAAVWLTDTVVTAAFSEPSTSRARSVEHQLCSGHLSDDYASAAASAA